MTEGQIVYRSSNGDDWILEDDTAGRAFVVHRANVASGGAVTRMPAEEFLQRHSASPEAQAVRQALEDSDRR